MSSDLGVYSFVRTTDQEPFFFGKLLQTIENSHLPDSGMSHRLPFFLYRSTNNTWFCSPQVGEDDYHLECVLRNMTLQNTRAVTEKPPLSGWEYLNEDREWKESPELRADTFVTLDSLDCSKFTRKPWAALKRAKLEDEVVITASEKDFRSNCLNCGCLCGLYQTVAEVENSSSFVRYESPFGFFIYNTARGLWFIKKVGDKNPFGYNESAQHSEWPPAIGWKDKMHNSLPIELTIKINPV